MPQAAFHFPTGFLWGTATAAYQVEGQNTNNNWYAWEQQEGKIRHGQHAGLACDWWGGRWREDLDRAAEGHQNAHRLSVEWSRIQPAPDRWDEDALDRYRTILRGLRDRNMTAMVTLHHFTDPIWLMEQGGWESSETPALFAKFVHKTVEALQEYCTLWITINEPNIYAFNAYLSGDFPPGKKDPRAAVRVLANLVRGHALAYHTIHALQPQARVGIAAHYRGFQAAGPVKFLDQIPTNLLNRYFNEAFNDTLVDGKFNFLLERTHIPEAAGTQDFIGLNYYTLELVRVNPFKKGDFFTHRFYPPAAEVSSDRFIANVPQGITLGLKWAHHYNLPIIVSENGVEDSDDRLRPRYLVEHIHQIWRAVNNNWPIKGYFHWSLVDNFEWERGWTQRFGLWGLNEATQQRIRRPSGDLYAAICQENGITSEMVGKYCPAVFDKLFPA